jgi:cell division protein FtsB
MTNYLLAFIAACVLIIAFLIFLVKVQTAKVDKLTADLATKTSEYKACTDINAANTKEFKKIADANAKAKETAQAALDKAKAGESLYRKRLWEVLNAKDNGAIPGVVQRTLDGVRERAASYQDRESSSVYPRQSVVMHIPS